MKRLFISLLSLATFACVGPSQKRTGDYAMPNQNANVMFANLTNHWLDGLMRLSPISATRYGDHRFDDEVDDLSAQGRAARTSFDKAILAELQGIDTAQLTRENQVDARILRNELHSALFNEELLQEWRTDPLLYNRLAGDAIYNLLAREFAPLPVRMRAAAARMQKMPALLAQARANLDPARVPKVHAETVAKQNHGIIGIVDDLVVPSLPDLPLPQQESLKAAIATLRAAVAVHQAWIEKVLVPGARGDFRLGGALYTQKLSYALDSSLSAAEIRTRAERELQRVRSEMFKLAVQVLKQKQPGTAVPAQADEAQQQSLIEAALEYAYADRPARDQVVATAKQTLAQATEFVRSKDLVTVPNDPVKVILMPEFQRGVAVAYCDSPGPLDKGQATYYAISPIPEDWTAAQSDSFLREYNTRMMHLLSIHEAMPGHYLEGVHSAEHPSLLRAVLRSGLFAEGWAVYTEQMMTAEGYLDADPLFRLVQAKFYLRAIANAMLDYGVHVQGWEREQAMNLMVRQTFQQEREAAGKWTRAQLTSAQLPTYFVGLQEQWDLRHAVQAKQGSGFLLKRYHDQVLSYGAPATKYVRALMLNEAIP
ncbi:MAG: DUF885 domain-containing protein [Deltaproteobacteria bacterium]|nr:DUF885 domain-containing protein [Deltaproteobacteria bacterium]